MPAAGSPTFSAVNRPRPKRTAPPPPPAARSLATLLSAEPTLMLVPLRAFLGFTFCFAGLQKLANPNFFRAASPISIQAQLVAAERTSPLHHLLGSLRGISVLVGLVISVGELAVGLGVLTGVLTRLAALGGMVISFMLFLTVSFHARPYYTGADIGYFFAFTPFLLAGAGRLTLPALVDEYFVSHYRAPRRGKPGLADTLAVDQERRDLLVTGAVAAAGIALAALAAGVGRAAGGAKTPARPRQLSQGSSDAGTTTPTTAPGGGAGGSTTTSPSSGVPAGTKIGPAADVPVGASASFQDPTSGDPAVVIQARRGQFLAFDAVCPHAGCTVEYSSSQDVIVCPCHGSLFNASSGAVEQGPAAQNLRGIAIKEGSDGNLYVT